LRRSQQAGTLANFSRAYRSCPGGKAFGAAVAAAGLPPGRLPVWLKAVKREGLGGSLWVKLVHAAT